MSTSNPVRRRKRKDAAQYVRDKHGLPCSPNTLQKLASTGGGPKFRKFGNIVVYDESDLDEWVESKLTHPRSSTSDAV